MNSIVGFTIFTNLPENSIRSLEAAHGRALAYFTHLQRRTLVIGETHLELWGRNRMDERIHTLPDGSFAVLIGSPHGEVRVADVQDDLLAGKFEIPWDGRVILLRVSPDGRQWNLWNDWLGSIPVFHAEIGSGRIASTVEPVIVAAGGYTPNDFFMPGLVSLLINGHFISDWTLYRQMKTLLPDTKVEWDENGFRSNQFWSVKPSQSRWEAGWDDLVDEMHELSHKAIADVLKTQPTWILPLSSGMDSRLIAGVAADIGANVHAYAWGAPDTTDVIYSREIAKTLGFPWKRIDLQNDFLVKYTRRWAEWYGSGLHFHGMYLMNFLDELKNEPTGPVLSGLIGDTLVGDVVGELSELHRSRKVVDQVGSDWYVFWKSDELRSLMKVAIDEAIEVNVAEIKKMMDNVLGAYYQKLQFLELWGRQHLFTSYQATLLDYWRGAATPFLNRAYARFCLSLPRLILDDRHLQGEVFRRYYGKLAVIPGTYAKDPFILTGKYLVKRRAVDILPSSMHIGSLKGFANKPLRMDIESIQTCGREALWPLFNRMDQLSKWLDVNQLERDFQTLMRTKEDVLPLRRLQSAQTLAYRLLTN
jgi:hypothetical protein